MGFLTFVIVIIISAGFYYSNTINDRMKSGQIANFANKITSSAEVVFYAGEPSKATITAYLPDGVLDIQIIENSIVINHSLTTGKNVIAYSSSVPMVENLSSPLSVFSGIKSIVIVANQTHAIVGSN
jgi:preprotein translocase subunit YajC